MGRITTTLSYRVNEFRSFEFLDYETVNTVQDASMSLSDIVNRHLKGQFLPDIAHRVHYDGLDDFDQSNPILRPDFDISEAKQAIDSIADLQKKMTDARNEAKKAEAERSVAEASKASSAAKSHSVEDKILE